MATLNTLGVDTLSLRGSNGEYHRLSRFFRTRAEAEAALADGSWTIAGGVINACVTGDEGVLIYDETLSILTLPDGGTKAYIDNQIAALLGDVGTSLDTLEELANTVQNDPYYITNLETTLTEEIALRTGADVNHEAQLAAEVQARTDGDDTLQAQHDLLAGNHNQLRQEVDDQQFMRQALGIADYVDDAAAGTAGLTTGQLYYNTTTSALTIKS